MSRTTFFMTIVGVTVAAGAAGAALGLLYAPASGKELRRRLAWRASEEWQSAARAGNRVVGRAVARAMEELAHGSARFTETVPR